MAISKVEKQEIIKAYAVHEGDTDVYKRQL